MQKSTNYKANLPEGNNVIDISVLNKNITDIIDKGLILDVGDSTGNANNYVLNLGSITLTSANKGISFKFWADKSSTGATTINGTYNLVKANGNPVKNLKRNAPYTITYDGGTNFFLASGGVDDVNFSASDLLTGKTANDSDGEKVNGTMPNIGQQTATINAGGKVVISKGYHDGTGYVQSNTMSKQLSDLGSTLTSADQLVNGVKAVDKNGKLITGTANKYKQKTISITGDATITVPSDGTRLIACFASSTGGTIHGSACGFISFKISENNYMNFLVRYKENSTTTALEPYTTNSTGAIKSCKLYAGKNGNVLTRTAYIIYE